MEDTVCEPGAVVADIKPQSTTEEPLHEIQFTTTSTTTVEEVFPSESTSGVWSVVTLPPRQTKSNIEEGTAGVSYH